MCTGHQAVGGGGDKTSIPEFTQPFYIHLNTFEITENKTASQLLQIKNSRDLKMCLISHMVNGIKMNHVHVVRVGHDSTLYKTIHVRVNQLISCLWSLSNVVLISPKWSPSLWANLSGAHVTYQGPLVRKCSACDNKILPSFFPVGNFVWLECCFIFPMGRRQNLWSH